VSAQALVVEMYRAIERAEGRGSVDRARKAARAAGAESFSNSDATRWLAPFVKAADGSRDGKRTGFGRANKHETDGKRTENGRPDGLARGKGIPVEDLETTGPTVPTSLPIAGDVPDLFGQAQPPKPAKTVRVNVRANYAGTTFEDFGPLEGAIREIVGRDATRDGTMTEKALATALESLAMWRVQYGDEAFAHGVSVTLGAKGNGSGPPGHRYVGGVAKRYDPDQEPRRFEDPPNASDLLPTLTELIQAGKAEGISDAVARASRPAWFNAQLEAGA